MNRNFSEKLNYAYDHRFDKDSYDNILLHREIYDRILAEQAHQPRNIALAMAYAEYLRSREIRVDETDILLGHSQHFDYVNNGPCARIPITWMKPRGYRIENPISGGGFEAQEYLKDYPQSTDSETYKRLNRWVCGLDQGLYSHILIAHTTLGYDRFLDHGIDGLLEQSRRYDHDVARANIIVLQACADYISRYAKAADEAAASAQDPSNRLHLQKLAAAAANIAHKRPANYREALQLIWFIHEMYAMESIVGAMSLGRLDVYLTPFYEMEPTDYHEALLMMCDFNFKICLWGGEQNVMVGGKTETCDYLFSDVTRLIVEATRITRQNLPQLSARINDHIPQECMDLFTDTIAEGGGFPTLFNEDLFIESLIKKGIPREDAERFCVVGCVEVNIPGKAYTHTEGARINYGKVMELQLNEGYFANTVEQMPVRTRENYDTFEQLYADFRHNALAMTELLLWCNNLTMEYVGKRWPLPFTTATMHGCLESGRDAADGGTMYPYACVNAIAIQDAANSLLALKKLVFEQGVVSYRQFKLALADNFEGHDGLLQQIRNLLKYGNDNDEADRFVAELTQDFLDFTNAYPTPYGKTYNPGLYSFAWHGTTGAKTMALPNGRKAGTALSNGFGPQQGTDINGPTAVINSVCKCDLSTIVNGMVLDLKFTPAFFQNPAHRTAFQMLVKTYMKKGGPELQVNVVDRQTLLDAQLHPEDHRDLLVRVSGYSAFFVSLPKVLQDEIVARTEHILT